MSEKRLESIDLWKGITILSVLVIHTTFWSGRLYLPDWTRSLSLLLDVPVFFFISGYLLQSSEAKVIGQRSGRQLIRLVTDYAVISIIALTLAVVVFVVFRLEVHIEPNIRSAIMTTLKFHPTDSTSESVWDIFQVFGGSMWYLRVYFSVLLLGILILASPLKRGLLFLPLISYAVFLLTTMYPLLVQPFLLTDTQYATFYLTLFLAGAVFKEYKNRLSMSGLSLTWAFLLVASLVSVVREGGLHDLQEAKFPPSSLYLLFSLHSILAFCLLVLFESKKPFMKPKYHLRSFFSWCGQQTYRIYLWQGVAASIPFFFIPYLLEKGIPTAAIFAIVLVWNIGASLALTYGYNRVVPVKIFPGKG